MSDAVSCLQDGFTKSANAVNASSAGKLGKYISIYECLCHVIYSDIVTLYCIMFRATQLVEVKLRGARIWIDQQDDSAIIVHSSHSCSSIRKLANWGI